MPATKSGWFIRVCKTLTEASSIEIDVGLGGESATHRRFKTWNSADEAEFDLPADLINVREVFIKGVAVPRGRNVHMCVLFKDHVTQKMEFDQDEEHETSQDDSDQCGC
jgi:hypothetical protein